MLNKKSSFKFLINFKLIFPSITFQTNAFLTEGVINMHISLVRYKEATTIFKI